VTEALSFLESINALPGVRAGWIERMPGIDVVCGRDEAMCRLRPAHQRILTEAGCKAFARAEQVHGTEVAIVPGSYERLAADGLPVVTGVDGLVTIRPGLTLVIYSADCGAIWLADQNTGAIGLLHSGRKGTEGNILEKAICRMTAEFGSKPDDLVAVLSPCIRPPDYEVDFAGIIREQARQLGISGFTDCGLNTAADPERFYSYRRELGQTGRMLAWIRRDFLP
jgi:copper oxidase (laccase) domain-containing protein